MANTAQSCLLPIRGGGIHRRTEGSTGALRALQEVLALEPENLRARWLLNVAHMTLGGYPDRVPPDRLIPPSVFASEHPLPRFPNIADQAGGTVPDYPQLSAEYIVKANPELIILSDTKCCAQTPEKVAARPGWSEIDAVANGNVVPVDDDIASRWGPRTVDFVQVVADAIEEARTG